MSCRSLQDSRAPARNDQAYIISIWFKMGLKQSSMVSAGREIDLFTKEKFPFCGTCVPSGSFSQSFYNRRILIANKPSKAVASLFNQFDPSIPCDSAARHFVAGRSLLCQLCDGLGAGCALPA